MGEGHYLAPNTHPGGVASLESSFPPARVGAHRGNRGQLGWGEGHSWAVGTRAITSHQGLAVCPQRPLSHRHGKWSRPGRLHRHLEEQSRVHPENLAPRRGQGLEPPASLPCWRGGRGVIMGHPPSSSMPCLCARCSTLSPTRPCTGMRCPERSMNTTFTLEPETGASGEWDQAWDLLPAAGTGNRCLWGCGKRKGPTWGWPGCRKAGQESEQQGSAWVSVPRTSPGAGRPAQTDCRVALALSNT